MKKTKFVTKTFPSFTSKIYETLKEKILILNKFLQKKEKSTFELIK